MGSLGSYCQMQRMRKRHSGGLVCWTALFVSAEMDAWIQRFNDEGFLGGDAVEYEGLPLICYNCGFLGHNIASCTTELRMQPPVVKTTTETDEQRAEPKDGIEGHQGGIINQSNGIEGDGHSNSIAKAARSWRLKVQRTCKEPDKCAEEAPMVPKQGKIEDISFSSSKQAEA
ncbi:OLC1v1031055C1 [Oldenlandia corymbosa var. corymbosa]|uniref:OLC1v1031055C1 n=1 Tax=Oldenlandia corymbosa var. corymbosa TaxID=529605 RepID=A0AAV1CHP3_OLDCO|nr:OLC1v1031055C1 [Oldenlandia corymbosa var. corymbosa]